MYEEKQQIIDAHESYKKVFGTNHTGEQYYTSTFETNKETLK